MRLAQTGRDLARMAKPDHGQGSTPPPGKRRARVEGLTDLKPHSAAPVRHVCVEAAAHHMAWAGPRPKECINMFEAGGRQTVACCCSCSC